MRVIGVVEVNHFGHHPEPAYEHEIAILALDDPYRHVMETRRNFVLVRQLARLLRPEVLGSLHVLRGNLHSVAW